MNSLANRFYDGCPHVDRVCTTIAQATRAWAEENLDPFPWVEISHCPCMQVTPGHPYILARSFVAEVDGRPVPRYHTSRYVVFPQVRPSLFFDQNSWQLHFDQQLHVDDEAVKGIVFKRAAEGHWIRIGFELVYQSPEMAEVEGIVSSGELDEAIFVRARATDFVRPEEQLEDKLIRIGNLPPLWDPSYVPPQAGQRQTAAEPESGDHGGTRGHYNTPEQLSEIGADDDIPPSLMFDPDVIAATQYDDSELD